MESTSSTYEGESDLIISFPLRFINAFETPSEVILVMEYLDGGELFERVAADDFNLTESDCCLFMRQIVRGVQYLHKHHIVHLDLKVRISCNKKIVGLTFQTENQIGVEIEIEIL